MAELKLLNKSFNIVEISHVPTFLAPYSFVISMPHKLTLICTENETPSTLLSAPRHTTCFVLNNETIAELLHDANNIIELLSGANIPVQMVSEEHSIYLFVGTDNAMTAVMLLSSHDYDIVYTDI